MGHEVFLEDVSESVRAPCGLNYYALWTPEEKIVSIIELFTMWKHWGWKQIKLLSSLSAKDNHC